MEFVSSGKASRASKRDLGHQGPRAGMKLKGQRRIGKVVVPMSNLGIQPDAGSVQTAGLNQWQRAGNVFVAPSKTFDDIKRGNCSWWLPFLILLFFSYVLFAGITMKIGWQQVAANNIAVNPRQAQRIDQLNPAQRATAMKIAGTVMEIFLAASPVLILIGACLVSLLLWGTINFGFGGKASFP